MTPLGLYDVVEPLGSVNLEQFRFINDTSAFGYGTPPRSAAPFTRSCGNAACPGLTMNQTCTQKGLAQVCNDTVIDRSIPSPLVSLFRDGARQFAKPVSSIFDIQWRAYLNATDSFSPVGWYIKSAYRQISMLIPESKVHVVEGLIVDTEAGGIGFRRHSVPGPLHEYGSEWTEDILFIEPETKCVDMNVTFDFTLRLDDGSAQPQVKSLALIDHGGFSNLSRTMPSPGIYPNGQSELDIREKAYYAAWMSNFLTMAFFNLTDRNPKNFTRNNAKLGLISQTNSTQVNQTSADDRSNIFAIEYQSLRSSSTFGEYLADLPATPSERNKTVKGNPFAISKRDFYSVGTVIALLSHEFISFVANIHSPFLHGSHAQRLAKHEQHSCRMWSPLWSRPTYRQWLESYPGSRLQVDHSDIQLCKCIPCRSQNGPVPVQWNQHGWPASNPAQAQELRQRSKSSPVGCREHRRHGHQRYSASMGNNRHR